MRKLFISMGLMVAVLGVLVAGSCGFRSGDDEDECAIPLRDRPDRVTFLRTHIHPFMAEYSRRLRIERPGVEPVCCPLPVNVGGRTMINVYWLDERDGFGPMLLMRDHWGESLIDLERRETLHIVRVGADRIFAGRLDDERAGHGWMGSDESLYVHVGRNRATEITEHGIDKRLKYIGRLDGRTWPLRFIPAADAPEERVRTIGRPTNPSLRPTVERRSH
jgi:hypothetical protein